MSRPIRVLIAIPGLDQHETGALAVARLLRDAGMEVVYFGRFGMPDTITAAAIDEDVDVIGLSCHSWEYVYYLGELLQRLAQQHARIPVVIGGSVITEKDKRAMLDKGVSAAFGATATPDEIIVTVRALAAQRGEIASRRK